MTMKDNLVSLYWQSNIHEQDQSLRIEVEARSRQTICWWRNPRDQKPVHGDHLILELREDQNPLRVCGEEQFLQCPVQRIRLQIHFQVQICNRCLYRQMLSKKMGERPLVHSSFSLSFAYKELNKLSPHCTGKQQVYANHTALSCLFVSRWHELAQDWLAWAPRLQVVLYEDLVLDPVRETQKMLTFLGSAANRLIGEVVQSRRRPLLGPSPG